MRALMSPGVVGNKVCSATTGSRLYVSPHIFTGVRGLAAPVTRFIWFRDYNLNFWLDQCRADRDSVLVPGSRN